MSAAASPALAKAAKSAERRGTARHPIHVPLDVILLRSGVPENLPGRCTDLSEGGVGAMVAGELAAGQQVAVELRLPHVGVPVRVRAMVRYQGRLHCGFEFVGLAADQREMIRYWANVDAMQSVKAEPAKVVDIPVAVPRAPAERAEWPDAKFRAPRKWQYLAAGLILALAGGGWWQWQRSWRELETTTVAAKDVPLRVTSETMALRIVSRVEPVYPDEARRSGVQGWALLDAVIARDGSVKNLRTISGDELLVKSAMDAVRWWKFEPYQLAGKAVEVETTIPVEFRMK